MTTTQPVPALSLAETLAARFSQFPQVQAIALGGSLASGRSDSSSDIDLYVFTSAAIPLDARQALVAERGAARANLDLKFWDPGDEWVDAPSGIKVDVMYWSLEWMEEQIARVLERCQPSLGYTTSFWHTLRGARPLFDRSGWFARLQEKTRQPYPEALRQAIIAFNHSVLRGVIPAYSHQIELAVQRADAVSLNHRIAALLASYFDILYALNRELHPGEKRLLAITPQRCAHIPAGMVADIRSLLSCAAEPDERLLDALRLLLDRLDQLLIAEGFDPATSKPLEGSSSTAP